MGRRCTYTPRHPLTSILCLCGLPVPWLVFEPGLLSLKKAGERIAGGRSDHTRGRGGLSKDKRRKEVRRKRTGTLLSRDSFLSLVLIERNLQTDKEREIERKTWRRVREWRKPTMDRSAVRTDQKFLSFSLSFFSFFVFLAFVNLCSFFFLLAFLLFFPFLAVCCPMPSFGNSVSACPFSSSL